MEEANKIEYQSSFSNSIQNNGTMEPDQKIHTDINNQKLEQALFEITDGQHSTEAIGYIKSFIKQLIKQGDFHVAYNTLHQLVEARQAKTTTILWIGSYLKDIFFNENATDISSTFDKAALEEMLFYYLKACKLFDPGYQKVKDAVKVLEG